MAGDSFRRFVVLLRKNLLMLFRSPFFLFLGLFILFQIILSICLQIYVDGKIENVDKVKELEKIERPEFRNSYLFDTLELRETSMFKGHSAHLKMAMSENVSKKDFLKWKALVENSIDVQWEQNYENLKNALKSESAYAENNRSVCGLFVSDLNMEKAIFSYELLLSTKEFKHSPDFNTEWQKTIQLGFRKSWAILIQYFADFWFIENVRARTESVSSNRTNVRAAVNYVGIKEVTMDMMRMKNPAVAVMAVFAVRNILHEKANIMNFLSVLGVSNTVFYLSHMTVLLLTQLFAVLPVTLLISLNITKISFGYCFLSMVLEMFCVLSLVVLITTIWKKSSSATFVTIVVFFLPSNKIKVSPNVGHHSILFLFNFWIAVSHFEESIGRSAFQMQSVDFTDWKDHEYPPILLLSFMFIDCLLMLFIACSVEIVKNFIRKFRRSADNNDAGNIVFGNAEEEIDASAEVDISISDVSKVFPGGEKAVDGLNLFALKGQVTVLLGHNGAGKTTTFSMICGTEKPTKGSVTICGAVAGSSEAKRHVGYCSQENTLIPDMTVLDHLRLVYGLKCSNTNFKEEVDDLLGLVGLADREKVKVKRLSGGQKRKVCLCMALMGGSKVILLDEPTAGMDPESRQDVEMFLEKQKGSRTILLTTHYMDEAESLGDRVVIMSSGKVVCSGSVDFLKNRFASGYILTVLTGKSGEEEMEHVVKRLEAVIAGRVPGAVLSEQRGQEMDFNLPQKEKKNFSKLFVELERSKEELSISSYGLSTNTLEDVFLKVESQSNTSETKKVGVLKEQLKMVYEDENLSGWRLVFSQFGAMFKKKILYSLKHWPVLVFLQFALPVFVLLLTALLSQSAVEDIPAQNIGLAHFGGGYFVHQNHFKDFNSEFKEEFVEMVKEGKEKEMMTVEELDSSVLLKEHIFSVPLGMGAIYGVRCMNKDHGGPSGNCEEDHLLSTDFLTESEGKNGTETLEEHVLLLHNMKHLYSLPTVLNLFSNTLLHGIRQKGNINMSVSFYEEHDLKMNVGSEMGILLSLLMALVFANFAEPISEDISIGFMRQQFLAGLRPWIYWGVEYLYAFLLFSFQCIFYLASFYYVGLSAANIARAALLAFLLFFIVMPAVLFISQHSSSSTAATTAVAALLGIGLFQGLSMMQKFEKYFIQGFGEDAGPVILQCLFAAVFPTVPFAFGVSSLFEIQMRQNSGMETDDALSHYTSLCVSVAVMGFIYTCLFCGSQFRKIRNCCSGSSSKEKRAIPVISEPIVASSPPSNNSPSVLEVNDLSKVFADRKKDRAVLAHISLNVRERECFGLLGISGAGKTTAFNIITGQMNATEGTVSVDGKSPDQGLIIGMCPQFDTIHPQLTGKQALTLLAAVHGYKDVDGVSDALIEMVGMEDHADKSFGTCSGGQKRRLSVAAALLPRKSPFVILDEATAGIDPSARRSVWSVLSAVKGHSALLMSSHCMEECEALCTRIAILREGQIAASGSSQALKSSLGNFFVLSLTLSSLEKKFEADDAVRKEFPGSVMQRESFSKNIKWKVPKRLTDVWSKMFLRSEKVAKELKATDFSLTQPALQDIFLLIANKTENAMKTPETRSVDVSKEDSTGSKKRKTTEEKEQKKEDTAGSKEKSKKSKEAVTGSKEKSKGSGSKEKE